MYLVISLGVVALVGWALVFALYGVYREQTIVAADLAREITAAQPENRRLKGVTWLEEKSG